MELAIDYAKRRNLYARTYPWHFQLIFMEENVKDLIRTNNLCRSKVT